MWSIKCLPQEEEERRGKETKEENKAPVG